ncbi:NADP-dependent 3-hydroxy acid dehydrogenase YdfG [Kribbella amoyensis]|uniref:NADP-dependent 3-hydroxy acid dehydrogenase YdfG n=1 Tax=Kribbella amoyensis TaxID=996641 RepID=A0A561B381_9ACTN|nr:SDR family oxidoreductase [Kribbella amoyensis]TWD73326.1 NADP-dependent 3-hydroxy acid dehydrogenase YdfG [Kribbella amoyensis]
MRVTLITGGSSGIGAAAARQLLDLGHQVTVTGRNPDRLAAFADSLGSPDQVLPLVSDASDPAAVEAAVAETLERFGRLDNAVANAGFATHDLLDDGDPEGWRSMILTNVLGPAALIRYALPALRESRGRIVLVGSLAGHVHTAGNIYGATKFAVTGLAENTRLLVTKDGIGVTLVSPGAVETHFSDPVGGLEPGRERITADQFAAAIVWAVEQPEGVDINTLVVRPIGSPR